jgi:phage terminase large subunit GpA-like protein
MGQGLCHFPKKIDGNSDAGYITDYFTMLTSEKKVYIRNKNTGFGKYEWHKDTGKRNEALDCRVYARAALRICSSRDDLLLSRLHQKAVWLNHSSNINNNGVGNAIPIFSIKPLPLQKLKNNNNQVAQNNAITL